MADTLYSRLLGRPLTDGEEAMLDSMLAHQLSNESLGAAIDIDRLIRSINDPAQRLEQLTWTLCAITDEQLQEWDISAFFYRLLSEILPETAYKTLKTIDDLLPVVHDEINNLLMVLQRKPKANLERALKFCLTLNEHARIHQSPRRCLAA